MITTMRLLLLTILVAMATNIVSMVIAFFQGSLDMMMFLESWTEPRFWYTQLWMSPLYIVIALGVMLRPRFTGR